MSNVTARKDDSNQRTEQMMKQVVEYENAVKALRQVKANKGAAGVDGMKVEDLSPYLEKHWQRIKEELLNGTYQPQAVRKVEIPKPGGKGMRLLGIPTVVDRFIQQALNQVMQGVFDPGFSNSSYGFRPGRGTHGKSNPNRFFEQLGLVSLTNQLRRLKGAS